jgi:short-chain fatty acids transporter
VPAVSTPSAAFRRLGSRLAAFSERWVPDAFVFAILLTFLVYAVALVFTDRGPVALVEDWYRGFWDLLSFGMQMCLVLVTGHALASSPLVRLLLTKLASLPRSGRAAVALTALASGAAGWVHWGLGLVTGALLAREVTRLARARGIAVHLPLVAAAGYLGSLVWHSGLSGSAPLLVNTPGHFLEDRIGLVPLTDTLFRPFNLVYVVGTLVIAPLLLAAMHPAPEESAADLPDDEAAVVPVAPLDDRTPVQRLAHSPVLVVLIVVAGLVHLVPYFLARGLLAVDLNIVNFCFLLLGLALHGSLAAYAEAAVDGARAASGVIIQFPFYAGIMGLMISSGLVTIVAGWFTSLSTPLTFPLMAMTSAALVNLAVPSGGGQWAVQGPIVVEAGRALGVDTGTVVMAVALGDQLTNMIQPFWALPLLGITGLRAGQVLGYTALVMIVAYAIGGLAITFLR